MKIWMHLFMVMDHDRNQEEVHKHFLDTSRLSMEDLKLKAIIKDASGYSVNNK